MRNPARRNRRPGTARHERGRRNKMRIPTRTHPETRYYLANLGQYTTQKHKIGLHNLLFVIEKPRLGCAHACSVDDIMRVLNHAPAEDLRLLNFVILRQPKRKEELLKSAWGRWCPGLKVGDVTGCAIFLEVQDTVKPLRWEKPVFSEWLEELEKLRSLGARVIETPRHFEIFSPLEAVQQRQLFGTLPHEIGHHRHWLTDENFWRRTDRECEEFAERYAREFMEKFGALLE